MSVMNLRKSVLKQAEIQTQQPLEMLALKLGEQKNKKGRLN